MYQNLSVGKKLTISFGVILLVFMVAVVFSILSIGNVAAGLDDFYEQPYQVVSASKNIGTSLQSMAKNMLAACATNNISEVNSKVAEVDNNITSFQADLAILQQKLTESDEKALLAEVQTNMSEAGIVREQIVQFAKNNTDEDSQKAVQLYFSSYGPAIDEISLQLEEVEGMAEEEAVDYKTKGNNTERNVVIFLIILGSFSLILSILLGIRLRISLVKPIYQIRNAANELAKGNLKNNDIEYESKDEFGQLAVAMRKTIQTLNNYITDIGRAMKELAMGNLNINPNVVFEGDFTEMRDSILSTVFSFNDTLTEINKSSEQVAGSSEQVSNGATELSQGATEQSSSLQDLAGTVNQISIQVKETAGNALDGRQKVDQLSNEIISSNDHMEDMIQAMSEISGASGEIGKIIKTIEDIAFQTNILALNAAVEAARAGAAGKGFAVVADEVRNLASKSADAAKNTTSLIESTIVAVENGTKIADDTANSLKSVVQSAQEVTTTIDKISDATAEQAVSILQVTQGIDVISGVVQTNSATAEQSAAASEELSGQAQLLKQLVGRFKLRTEAVPVQNVLEYPEVSVERKTFAGKY